MYDNQVNQSVNQSISHICRAPTEAQFIFAWTKSVNSIIQNYKIWFFAYFKTFFFLKQRRCENGLPERKWRPIFINNVIFRTWNPKDENLKCETPGEWMGVGQDSGRETSGEGGTSGGQNFRMWDIQVKMATEKGSGCETPGWNGGERGFRVWDTRIR